MSARSSEGPITVSIVRIWLNHSLLLTASVAFQFARPSSSSRPTPLSHSRWLLNADDSSIVFTFDRPTPEAALNTVLSTVGRIVAFAYFLPEYKKPQPPVNCRL